jgi:hypothetical protein
MTNNNSTATGNPFDPLRFAVAPASLAAAQGHGDGSIVPQLTGLTVRKPNKQEYIRVHHTVSISAPILELKMERESYIVTPDVAAMLPGDVAVRDLLLVQTAQGALFLWPQAYIDPEAKNRNEWGSSARQAAAIARDHWVRVVSDMQAGRYNVMRAQGLIGAPVWPELSPGELLELAFGKERLIDSPSHPVVKRLLGVI